MHIYEIHVNDLFYFKWNLDGCHGHEMVLICLVLFFCLFRIYLMGFYEIFLIIFLGTQQSMGTF